MALDINDLNDAEQDVEHIAKLATSSDLQATDRFGNTKKTWSGIEQELGAAYAVTETGQNRAASEAAREGAEEARTGAETAADAAFAADRTFTTTAQGLAATTNGQLFLLKTADPMVYLIYANNAGVAVPGGTYAPASATRVSSLEQGFRQGDAVSDDALFAVADDDGNTPLYIDGDGQTKAGSVAPGEIVMAGTVFEPAASPEFKVAFTDDYGNVVFGVRQDGSFFPTSTPVSDAGWSELVLGGDDVIVHIGDSYTANHYNLKDKGYMAFLSALSPYRHVNYGVSGNDALDMQYRIVNGTSTFGATFSEAKARYAFLTSLANDGDFRAADLTYYAENIRRLVETVRACGPEPVITTEFPATAQEHALLRRIADEMSCGFVDCTMPAVEVGRLQLGPFHQGHPGTRTGGVFWLPMLDYIDRLPRPSRAIKIFRRRSTFAVSAIADLLYKNRIDRNARWKELTIGHYSITPETKFEELDKLGETPAEYNFLQQTDEYRQLINGSSIAIADYALLEITLPAGPVTLEAVELSMLASAAATVYVRDFLDVAASMPGKAQGSTPTNPTYLSKWDKPRGAWRSLGVYSAPITISGADLRRSMQGNTLVVMVAGAFNLSGLKVRYKGREMRSDVRQTVRPPAVGAEVLAQQLCGTSGQLAAWTTAGSPALVVPIDQYNAPRKPATNTPVDGVAVITSADTIGQAIAMPAETGFLRRFRLTVWARYFPKAFLDPSLYPTLDPGQIVNRITNPSDAPITRDSHDLRTLKCEFWSGTPYPAAGGSEFFDFAALQWRPVEFVFEALPFATGATLSFRLSCPDGAIQVAKASFKEIAA